MRRLIVLVVVLLFAVIGSLFTLRLESAHAAGFTVDSTADAVDLYPGDGSCATATGACTLRAAIQEANALSGADTITVPAGTYVLAINVYDDAAAGGDLDITSNLTITGAGVTDTIIDGGALDRVFHMLGSSTVEISDLTIRNGAQGNFAVGGGVYNVGATVTMTGTAIVDNHVYGELAGGGIFNGGELTLINSTVSGNSVTGGTVAGGGIYNGGTLELINSTVSDNSDGPYGLAAGIANFYGGAVLTLRNSTVSGNENTGISNWFGATMTIENSTVLQVGSMVGSGESATLKNTIVVGCALVGAIISQGHNLEDSNGCGLSGPGDISNADPMLGPLQNNAGPTETHALLPGSPAIDAGSGDCPPPATDQRGVIRPQGLTCDIGAFEMEVPVPVGGLSVDLASVAGGGVALINAAVMAITGAAVVFAMSAAVWYARRRFVR